MKPKQHAVQALISVLHNGQNDHDRVRAAELLLSYALPDMPEDAEKADGAIKAQGKNWFLEADGTLHINGAVIGNLDDEKTPSLLNPPEGGYLRGKTAIEAAARAVYEQWRNCSGWQPWVSGGTSDMQEKARGIARNFLLSAR